jgi:hypothetical protein
MNSSTLARGIHAWSTVVQIWPAFSSLANRMRSAARRSGKSSQRMAGALPPSSSVTGTRLAAAAAITARPVWPEPVNSRWSNGSLENSMPTPPVSSKKRSFSGGK